MRITCSCPHCIYHSILGVYTHCVYPHFGCVAQLFPYVIPLSLKSIVSKEPVIFPRGSLLTRAYTSVVFDFYIIYIYSETWTFFWEKILSSLFACPNSATRLLFVFKIFQWMHENDRGCNDDPCTKGAGSPESPC